MQFYDLQFTFQYGPHHNCGTSIAESDFHFPPDRRIANNVSQMSSHHQHFEICGYQDDTFEQAATWCQIGLYAEYFKISHQCCRDLSSHISIVWPSNIMQKLSTFHKQEKAALLTAIQCSSFEQNASTLIVVPCCMKPTNNTHLWSRNMMAITVSRLHNLECHWSTMLPLLAYMFCSSVW
jgi:hypothetical protein